MISMEKWCVTWTANGEIVVEDNLHSFADAWALSQPESHADGLVWRRARKSETLDSFKESPNIDSIIVASGFDEQNQLVEVIRIMRHS